MDERLARAIGELRSTGWAAFVLDAGYRLVWVSEELRSLLGGVTDDQLGIGQHALLALLLPGWREAMTPETGLELLRTAGAHMLAEGVPDAILESVPEPFDQVLAGLQPVPAPPLWSGSFQFVQPGRPPYLVEFVVVRIQEMDGETIGTVSLSNMAVRAGLLAELGRGDAAMYERMARLLHPDRHAAAILFADLEGSGALSRTLPTSAYFELVRDLTSAFDALVAEHTGIVGKHAGDGWTGFVLADDAGGPSAAVAGCLHVARGLRRRADAMTLPGRTQVRINVGVHWAAGVYLGQLVPGSRLDVTALGDEVNECARIQECARGGSLLVSKQAIELLDADDAGRLDLDPAGALYQALAEMDSATDKTRRDAGTLAVTAVAPQGAQP